MKRIFVGLLGLLICFGGAGCQKTPEKSLVGNKGEDTLSQAIAATPGAQLPLEAPATWTHTFGSSDGAFSIVVDAAVELPDAGNYPVAKVRKIDLTEAWLKNFIQRLSNGGKVYQFKDETMYTKSEIEEILINLRREQSDPSSDFNSANLTEEERAARAQEIEEDLRLWLEAYEAAPETYALVEQPIKYSQSNTGRQQFSCSLDLGKDTLAYVSVSRSEAGGYVVIANQDPTVGQILSTTEDLQKLDKLAIHPDEAANLGLDFLKSLGEENFAPALVLGGYMQDPGNPNAPREEQPQCYQIFFTRSVEGVNTTYRNTSMDAFLMNGRMVEKAAIMEQYAPFWPQESVEMIITDTGVQYVRWEMPTEQVEVCNTNVALLPFSEIQQIFETQMMVEGLWTNPADMDVIAREIVITKVTLGMMQIREKNTRDGLLMVPTWNFQGYEIYTYAAPVPGGYILDENNQYVNDQLAGHSFLSINAIDGSIINPILGY